MGGLNIAFVGYREWALKIINNSIKILDKFEINEQVKIIKNKHELSLIDPSKFQLIFFFGWSYFVPAHIHRQTNCIVLHPSSLPSYRGGSPLQNQIIEGVNESKISYFLMNSKIDEGDLVYQIPLSLKGNLQEILDRIIEYSPPIILAICLQYLFLNKLIKVPQGSNNISLYKRRKPSMSEISLDDFGDFTALELHNKIRSLQDPYPNAYVKCKNGSKLFITNTHL